MHLRFLEDYIDEFYTLWWSPHAPKNMHAPSGREFLFQTSSYAMHMIMAPSLNDKVAKSHTCSRKWSPLFFSAQRPQMTDIIIASYKDYTSESCQSF